ncbi:GGDEF domain-containing protein [Candidatus Epulonipiscium viviparus]|uniref:GGDEF domain-containing protein n=1 Tax=Candidatus Epulonipiscium viviparus TaxID=420336 RepID=UPI0027380462|nr:GGDEF domain-containing protein [Candidatus Epulopiscium viviparus]
MAIIHLLSMSASIWAVVSLVGGHSLLTISSNPTYLIIIRVIVATICSTEMGLVLRNTSPESFQLIGRNHQRIKMLFLKLFFLLIVLIANSSFFNESWFKREIFLYQVVFGLCMIGVFYTALRLMIQYEATDKELTTQVECEGLTGLYNKMTTEKLISEFIETKQDGVLFMVDLDNFKAINDNLGHDKGDQVLQEMATELKAIFADADVIGRVGGDEFIIYFKTSVPNLHDKVLNVHKNLTKTYSDGHINVTVSASLGIANVMDDTTTFKELYRFADIALYQSKKRGKNTFTIYNDITPELHPTK